MDDESRAVNLIGSRGSLTSRDIRELRRIIDLLECDAAGRKPAANDEVGSLGGENYSFEMARMAFECRRMRREILPETMCGDIPWDILLTLFNHMGGAPLSWSGVAHMIDVPITTTTRWVMFLEANQLVSSSDHPTDKRKKMLQLTQVGACRVETVLRKFHTIVRHGRGFSKGPQSQ